ncbi:MAG TPA: hypothetical protein VG536_04075 [Pseudomonas sp.]|nr:hypothetical protein [Pseudomonas sp.]
MTAHKHIPALRPSRNLPPVKVAYKVDGAVEEKLFNTMLPCVPVGAFDDGLLPVTVADNDLVVRIPVDLNSPVFEDGALGTLQLFWNGANYGTEYQVLDSDLTETHIELIVPQAELLTEGVYPLTYVGKTFPGGDEYFGDPAWKIEVDRTAPGGMDIAHLIFTPDIISDGVTPTKLDSNGNLPSRAAHWRELKLGDKLYPILIDIAGGEVEVDPIEILDDTPGQEVSVPIPRAKLEEIGDGQIAFTFFLEDRAGNRSIRAPAVTLDVLLTAVPPNWAAPTIPLAKVPDNFLGEAAARTPIGVVIPADGNFQPDDSIVVHWGGQQAQAELVSDPAADPLMTILLPYSLVQAAGNGARDVTYNVFRNNIDIGTSVPAVVVNVDLTVPGGEDPDPETPEHGNLIAAKVVGASGVEDIISPEDLELDATVVIPYQGANNRDVFLSGDIVQVAWGGRPLTPYIIQPADLTRDLVLTLTSTEMKEEGAGEFDLKYTIERALATPPGESNTALAPSKPVQVISRAQLPGGENLDTGSFPEANANNAINSEAAASGGGTPFRISDYLNMAVGDYIVLRFIAYDGYGAGANEVPTSEHTDTREISSDDLNRGYHEFLVPSDKLYLAGRPGGAQAGRGRALASYSIRNSFGTNNGADVEVLIDARPLP